jgi:hypothetical protein
MLTGQCYCGAIQYEISGALSSKTICHCSMCRGTTGAPCVAWFTVPAAGFRLLQGTPNQFRSSSHATRTFCGVCGTQLTFADDATPEELDVTTCSLVDAARIAPDYHIYMDSAMPWMSPGDRLSRYRHGSGTGEQVAQG